MRRAIFSVAAVLISWLIAPSPAQAQPAFCSTVDVKHETLRKLLVDEKQPDRRKYLQGRPNDSCGRIYVTGAQVTTSQGRLRLTANLSAELETPLGCVDIARDTSIVVLASPAYNDSELFLTNPTVHLAGIQNDLLDTIVDPLLKLARINPRERLKPLLAHGQSADGLEFALSKFTITDARVRADGIQLTVCFALSIE